MEPDLERMKKWANAAAGHPTWSVAYAEDVPKLITTVERLRWELNRLKADYKRALTTPVDFSAGAGPSAEPGAGPDHAGGWAVRIYTESTASATFVVDHPCPEGNCHIDQLHHVGEDGQHYCPTGFLWCEVHGRVPGTYDGPAHCEEAQ